MTQANPNIDRGPCERLEVGMPSMTNTRFLLNDPGRLKKNIITEKLLHDRKENWRASDAGAGRIKLVEALEP